MAMLCITLFASVTVVSVAWSVESYRDIAMIRYAENHPELIGQLGGVLEQNDGCHAWAHNETAVWREPVPCPTNGTTTDYWTDCPACMGARP